MTRFRLPHAVVLAPVLASLATPLFAQSTAHDHAAPVAASRSEAQVAFDAMKSLAGEWEGPVKTDLPVAAKTEFKPLHVTMRVTSRGNLVVHEFQEAGTPLDPAKYDHPVTMFYVDSERLNLVHYCDAGNRPHMTGKMSADGKTLEFDFVELSGSDRHGYMKHAVFTIVDANRHIEDWTFMMPGNKQVQARFDLRRVN